MLLPWVLQTRAAAWLADGWAAVGTCRCVVNLQINFDCRCLPLP